MGKMFRCKICPAKVRVVNGIYMAIVVAIVLMQKLRNIRAGRQRYPDSGSARVFGIVEQESLAHLTGCVAHDGIGIGVVSWRALKNLNAQRALFEQIELARQGVVHNVFEQRGITLAVAKMRTGQDRL